jgi:hypothetical protein
MCRDQTAPYIPFIRAEANVTINMLGRAKKVMIEKENTTIVSGGGIPGTLNS